MLFMVFERVLMMLCFRFGDVRFSFSGWLGVGLCTVYMHHVSGAFDRTSSSLLIWSSESFDETMRVTQL